jgi:small subunit ribosomal protein S17
MAETQQVVNKTRRRFTGEVTSVSGAKSVVVAVKKRVLHALYRKYLNRTLRYMAHDEASTCGVGDTVVIEECRPMSARKRWRVVKTVEKATA